MNKFEEQFLGTLTEELDGMDPSDVSAEGDGEVFDNALDNPDEESFGLVPGMTGDQDQYEQMIDGWVKRVDEFASFLNDPKDSMYRDISDMDKPDSKYDGVSKDSLKIITNIAQDLGTLIPVLKNIQHIVISSGGGETPEGMEGEMGQEAPIEAPAPEGFGGEGQF